jgi:threonylcarbamoyladenosine tRNA methylthiotransferase MtaB
MPTAAIGADVMTGFPGESDAEFEETRRLIEDLPLTYLHVFTYSARPGTPAASAAGQVPLRVARERNRILRDLASHKKEAFMRRFVGKHLQTIILNVVGSDHLGEYTEGLTDNYLPIRLRGKHQSNSWIPAKIESVWEGALVGIAA